MDVVQYSSITNKEEEGLGAKKSNSNRINILTSKIQSISNFLLLFQILGKRIGSIQKPFSTFPLHSA